MATKVIVHVSCDLHDGADGNGASPVRFGIDGNVYQVDACPRCAARLRAVLGEFITRARRAGTSPELLPPREGTTAVVVEGAAPKRDLIVRTLRARIADGTYPPGSYLPAQRDLAAEHGTSATPVRYACWALESEAVIQGTAGHRYIVQGNRPRRRAART